MARRRTWFRSLAGIGLLIAAAALPACGSSNSSTPAGQQPAPVVDPGTPTEDLTISNYLSVSMTPVGDEGTFAVIDGTAPDDAGTVKATLRIGDFDGDVAAYDLPTPPLLYPTTWNDGGTVYVQGQACDEPLVDQIGEGDPDEVCGTDLGGSTLLAFDIATGQSRIVSSDLGADEFGNLDLTPAGPVALLRTYISGSDFGDPDPFEYALLDAATGDVTALGAGPSTEQLCPTDQGFIALQSSDTFDSTTDASDIEIRLTVIDQDGTRVLPAPDPPATLQIPFSTGCESGALIFPDTATGTTTVHLDLDADGTPTWSEVEADPLPDEGGVPIDVPGGRLAWEPTGDTGTSFEGYIPHLLLDGRWDARPLVSGPDSPSLSAISGTHLLTLGRTGPQGGTLVVR